jgi:MoxR-like ATPase
VDKPSPARRVRAAIHQASAGLVERDVLAELIALSAVAGEHLLVIGPPGTGKSEVVRRVTRAVGGRYFEYLLGRFTEPSEIFGPVDLRKLKDGVVETETRNMLPEAEIAFLDEVFLGSTAILNTLLAVLNERVFRRGHTVHACPLRVCVGASNALPEDETLAAFADRFLSRVFVDAVPDHALEALLEGGHGLARVELAEASVGDLDELAALARAVDVTPVRGELAACVRTLRGAGITLSDRRAVKVQRLVAAAAALDGRTVASGADLWPLVYAVPTREEQDEARTLLRERLAAAASGTLGAAAEDASHGPAARAERLVRVARGLLAADPSLLDAPGAGPRAAWRLKLEGVAREIDAGFAPDTLPEALAAARAELAQAIGVAVG